jgi:hypothetical protein
MNNAYGFKPLELNKNVLNVINDISNGNNDEDKINQYKNSHIEPAFRVFNDDTNLDLGVRILPSYDMTYKTKSIFPAEKPIQTEQDEIGINTAFLNNYYGYKNYGFYNVANQSLPDKNKHKYTSKNYLYDLF